MKFKNQNSKIKNYRVIENKCVKGKYFQIVIDAPEIAAFSQPGQFVNIKVSDGLEPLLRRPLSIHKVIKNNIAMLYEAVGKGTEILSRRKTGECLDVIGPLGNGFRFDRGLSTVDYRPILIAGGMGTAPLVFLAERLVHSPQSIVHRKPLVLIGARSESHILCEKEFKELGCEVKIATDDGSRGFKGYVSELLKQELSAIRWPEGRGWASDSPSHYPLSAIYSCGPKLLLKEISRISLERNIPAQLSLESHMACGIGACMGCVIKIKNQKSKIKNDFEYKRVCKEGPVFEANQILWE